MSILPIGWDSPPSILGDGWESERIGPSPELLRASVRAELKERATKRARTSFAEFFRQAWHVLEPGVPLSWNWHVQTLCDHLQWMYEDWEKARAYFALHGEAIGEDATCKDQRAQELCINVPPGTAKSRIVSVMFPAWIWACRDASWRVLCLSANPDVAGRDSGYCRDLIESDWYQDTFKPKWTLKESTKTKYTNTSGGERSAKGLNAAITGSRADAILIDDPNDAKQIHSDTHRDTVNKNLDQAVGNRVNDLRYSFKVMIMQRLHEDDAAGHVLSQGWHHLCLPMEYDPDQKCTTVYGFEDPRTVKGEVLHPVRFTRAVLEKERKRLGTYGYAGQMQQRPSPAGGGLFKRIWWGWFKHAGVGTERPRPNGCPTRAEQPAVTLPTLEWLEITIDCAFKGKADSDLVSMLVVGGCQADRFVLEDRTKIRTFNETLKAIRQLRIDYPKAHRILIEDKANGPAVINMLGSEMSGLVAINPEGGKESRANACSPQVESGNVYLLDGAAWGPDFVQEFDSFPNGKHDDRVDALTQMLISKTLDQDAAHASLLLSL